MIFLALLIRDSICRGLNFKIYMGSLALLIRDLKFKFKKKLSNAREINYVGAFGPFLKNKNGNSGLSKD